MLPIQCLEGKHLEDVSSPKATTSLVARVLKSSTQLLSVLICSTSLNTLPSSAFPNSEYISLLRSSN